ncbi:MAG: glutathione S-transferase family protein [Steroidobacteraceae bacterium]
MMQLIGQYDSPFVRRVAVALKHYGLAFDHLPWSVFGDAERIRQYNPLTRVPALVLEDGAVIIESAAIIDWLDELVPAERALMARTGVARRAALKVCALSTGLADKAVSLVYESVIHQRDTALWQERCRAQIKGALEELTRWRERSSAPWLLGSRLGHGDIAMGCALRFVSEALPEVLKLSDWPALARHSAQCEALVEFREAYQAFRVVTGESAQAANG